MLAMYLHVSRDLEGIDDSDTETVFSLLDLLESLICVTRPGTTRDLLAKARLAAVMDCRSVGDASGRSDREGRAAIARLLARSIE